MFIGVPSTAAVGAAPALDGNVRPKLSVGQDNTHGRMALLPALHLPAGTVVWAMPSRRTTQSSHGETDRHVGPGRRRGVDSTDSTTLIRWHRSGGSGTSAQIIPLAVEVVASWLVAHGGSSWSGTTHQHSASLFAWSYFSIN